MLLPDCEVRKTVRYLVQTNEPFQSPRSNRDFRISQPTDSGISTRTPIAVEPSLIASREYSTWNKRPSGEKVLWEIHCQTDEGETFHRGAEAEYGPYLIPRSIEKEAR